MDIIDAEVRELIRRRGLDPWRDPGQIGTLVDEVIADYEDRSLSSSLPPVGDSRFAARAVLEQVAGFGALQRYLDDPEIEEIWVNEPGRVFVARHGRSELTTTIMTAGQIADLVELMLRTSGRRLDLSTPFVDALMPDGSRLHVVIPDTIRYYERSGLIPPAPRTVSDHRRYGETDVDRLRFIQGAQRLGLRLRDIADLLSVRDTGRCPCEPAEQLLRERITEIDRELTQLTALRADLVRMADALPSDAPPDPAPGRWCPPEMRR
ncbi:MAG: Flp pilus assembly complex ATPase component TadA [Geodermatophilaceae bacterium]|nr:Flp pilus assembly complex ATPase component TadA [Geodermatophilaceae bacterium]